jgi:hypothetical protein
MFVRKKPNASGIISIQIIDKSRGDYQMIKTIGSSADPAEVESLFAEGKKWIRTHLGSKISLSKLIRRRKKNRPLNMCSPTLKTF